MSKEGNYCTDSLSAERIKTRLQTSKFELLVIDSIIMASSQVVKYYERRAEILDEVLSLRENCPIDGKSLHAHTGMFLSSLVERIFLLSSDPFSCEKDTIT